MNADLDENFTTSSSSSSPAIAVESSCSAITSDADCVLLETNSNEQLLTTAAGGADDGPRTNDDDCLSVNFAAVGGVFNDDANLKQQLYAEQQSVVAVFINISGNIECDVIESDEDRPAEQLFVENKSENQNTYEAEPVSAELPQNAKQIYDRKITKNFSVHLCAYRAHTNTIYLYTAVVLSTTAGSRRR